MEKRTRMTRSQKREAEQARKRTFGWLSALVIIAAIGLAYKLLSGPSGPTCEAWFGFDASGSVPLQAKESSCRLGFHIYDVALPTRCLIHTSFYGDDSYPIATTRPAAAADLYPLLEALRGWKCRRPGTRPDAFIESAIPKMRAARGRRSTVLLLFTDGEVTNAAGMRAAIQRLVAVGRPTVVWIAGVSATDRTRADVEKLFAPLGDRLIVTGNTVDAEIPYALNKLASLLSRAAGGDAAKRADAARITKEIRIAIERWCNDGSDA